jgi:hypothetical protein
MQAIRQTSAPKGFHPMVMRLDGVVAAEDCMILNAFTLRGQQRSSLLSG